MAETNLNHLANEWELIWTNPSPTSNFADQTLSLNLNKYSFVRIEFRLSSSYTYGDYITIPVEGKNGDYRSGTRCLMTVFGTTFYSTSSTTAPYLYTRFVFAFCENNTSGITFEKGYRRNMNTTAVATEGNGYVIPTRIWAQ